MVVSILAVQLGLPLLASPARLDPDCAGRRCYLVAHPSALQCSRDPVARCRVSFARLADSEALRAVVEGATSSSGYSAILPMGAGFHAMVPYAVAPHIFPGGDSVI